ncbi:MAG: hypothetical protein ACFB0D_23900 [Phormidesmis sp.]
MLKPNPFVSLRDPVTGKWRVIFKFPQDRSVKSIAQSTQDTSAVHAMSAHS